LILLLVVSKSIDIVYPARRIGGREKELYKDIYKGYKKRATIDIF